MAAGAWGFQLSAEAQASLARRAGTSSFVVPVEPLLTSSNSQASLRSPVRGPAGHLEASYSQGALGHEQQLLSSSASPIRASPNSQGLTDMRFNAGPGILEPGYSPSSLRHEGAVSPPPQFFKDTHVVADTRLPTLRMSALPSTMDEDMDVVPEVPRLNGQPTDARNLSPVRRSAGGQLQLGSSHPELQLGSSNPPFNHGGFDTNRPLSIPPERALAGIPAPRVASPGNDAAVQDFGTDQLYKILEQMAFKIDRSIHETSELRGHLQTHEERIISIQRVFEACEDRALHTNESVLRVSENAQRADAEHRQRLADMKRQLDEGGDSVEMKNHLKWTETRINQLIAQAAASEERTKQLFGEEKKAWDVWEVTEARRDLELLRQELTHVKANWSQMLTDSTDPLRRDFRQLSERLVKGLDSTTECLMNEVGQVRELAAHGQQTAQHEVAVLWKELRNLASLGEQTSASLGGKPERREGMVSCQDFAEFEQSLRREMNEFMSSSDPKQAEFASINAQLSVLRQEVNQSVGLPAARSAEESIAGRHSTVSQGFGRMSSVSNVEQLPHRVALISRALERLQEDAATKLELDDRIKELAADVCVQLASLSTIVSKNTLGISKNTASLASRPSESPAETFGRLHAELTASNNGCAILQQPASIQHIGAQAEHARVSSQQEYSQEPQASIRGVSKDISDKSCADIQQLQQLSRVLAGSVSDVRVLATESMALAEDSKHIVDKSCADIKQLQQLNRVLASGLSDVRILATESMALAEDASGRCSEGFERDMTQTVCKLMAKSSVTGAIASHGTSAAMTASSRVANTEVAYEGLRKMMSEVVGVVERGYGDAQVPGKTAERRSVTFDDAPLSKSGASAHSSAARSESKEYVERENSWLLSRVTVARAIALHSAAVASAGQTSCRPFTIAVHNVDQTSEVGSGCPSMSPSVSPSDCASW